MEMEAEREIEEEAKRAIRRAEQEQERLAKLVVQQRKDKELADFNSLLDNANQFHKASLIRIYIKEVKLRALDQNKLSDELVKWIAWASHKADWCDPTVLTEDTLLQ